MFVMLADSCFPSQGKAKNHYFLPYFACSFKERWEYTDCPLPNQHRLLAPQMHAHITTCCLPRLAPSSHNPFVLRMFLDIQPWHLELKTAWLLLFQCHLQSRDSSLHVDQTIQSCHL